MVSTDVSAVCSLTLFPSAVGAPSAPVAAPMYAPDGYVFKGWARVGKVFLACTRAGHNVAVKISPMNRRVAHELAMLEVRCARVWYVCVRARLMRAFVYGAGSVCGGWCLFCLLRVLTQVMRGCTSVVDLLDYSTGPGRDGRVWSALVFERLEMTVQGACV